MNSSYMNLDLKKTNTTVNNGGGFGNHLLRNLCSSIIAEQNDLVFTYSNILSNDGAMPCHQIYIEDLGIGLFKSGKKFYSTYIDLSEKTFEILVTENVKIYTNIKVDSYYYQTPFIAKYLRNYLAEDEHKTRIIQKNKFRERYRYNNDVFIHIRIKGAAQEYLPDYNYIDLALSRIKKYDNIYLASDEYSNPYCVDYITKYKMIPINYQEIETIQFGSTCRYIVLTNGTFGWITGVLGYFSEVYQPDLHLKPQHHGDIFTFDDWNVVGPET